MHYMLGALLLSSVARADIPPPPNDGDSGCKCDHASPALGVPVAILATATIALRRRTQSR